MWTKPNSIGETIIASMVGKNVHEYTFKERIRQITLGQKFRSAKMKQLRLIPNSYSRDCVCYLPKEPSTQQQQEHFQYELCGLPTALFNSFGLPREAKKPALADAQNGKMTSPVQSVHSLQIHSIS
ncbi:hypothetical protein GWK47_011620 [Chionoecetes opilio]|uniref:Uncharacterized protein n=1 Tax=Chionoecetes opilio TaxID=41210 RepID=A0A8J4Y2Q7_CHIOP|nr:hypothetical protein GWK47_011620 [Chionoecetes opilio]